jgi:hypothetical protein
MIVILLVGHVECSIKEELRSWGDEICVACSKVGRYVFADQQSSVNGQDWLDDEPSKFVGASSKGVDELEVSNLTFSTLRVFGKECFV